MVKMITLTRQVSPAARPAVLGSAALALATGGTEASTSVMKTQHDTAKAVIGNLR
jgi:hypothetical protein